LDIPRIEGSPPGRGRGVLSPQRELQATQSLFQQVFRVDPRAIRQQDGTPELTGLFLRG